jgi:hypothetical protein
MQAAPLARRGIMVVELNAPQLKRAARAPLPTPGAQPKPGIISNRHRVD